MFSSRKESSKVAGLRFSHRVQVILGAEGKSQSTDRSVECDENSAEIQQNEGHK